MLLDTILKRRSNRDYTDEKISKDKLEKIIQAGLLAPTSRNRKPCELVVVQDKQTLKKLSKSKKSGSAMIEKCHTAIVVFADSQKADTWIEDSSIMLAYMDLMANELGIGSCWCQSHLRYTFEGKSSEVYIRELFEKEENYRIVGILSLGIPKNNLEPHQLSEVEWNRIKYV